MKKLNKGDLKKLALLGLAGGTAFATQANADQSLELTNVDTSQHLALASCGGNGHGCGGGVAYRTNSNYYYNQAPQSGCSSNSQQYYQQQPQQYYQQQPQQYYQQQSQVSSGCANVAQPQYQQQATSSGCASVTQQTFQQPAPQVTYGCAGKTQMNKMMAGCAHVRQNEGQMPTQPESPAPVETPKDNVKKGEAYTQWETADNYLPQSSKRTSYQQSNDDQDSSSSKGSAVKQKMTESDLLSQLNPQGKATYQGLDPAGKALALKLANQDCKGQNECKGLNSCKTSEHSCAGKGSCAGTSAAPFKDKNLAVKVAAMKMAEKRANAASSKS